MVRVPQSPTANGSPSALLDPTILATILDSAVAAVNDLSDNSEEIIEIKEEDGVKSRDQTAGNGTTMAAPNASPPRRKERKTQCPRRVVLPEGSTPALPTPNEPLVAATTVAAAQECGHSNKANGQSSTPRTRTSCAISTPEPRRAAIRTSTSLSPAIGLAASKGASTSAAAAALASRTEKAAKKPDPAQRKLDVLLKAMDPKKIAGHATASKAAPKKPATPGPATPSEAAPKKPAARNTATQPVKMPGNKRALSGGAAASSAAKKAKKGDGAAASAAPQFTLQQLEVEGEQLKVKGEQLSKAILVDSKRLDDIMSSLRGAPGPSSRSPATLTDKSKAQAVKRGPVRPSKSGNSKRGASSDDALAQEAMKVTASISRKKAQLDKVLKELLEVNERKRSLL